MSNEMSDQERREWLEAQRLEDALSTLEVGHDPEVDPREDPSLSSLLTTAEAVRTTWSSVVPDTEVSNKIRSSILNMLKSSVPEPAPVTNVVPLYRRWSVLSPIASAAAAAVVTFAITTFITSDAPIPLEQPSFASSRIVTDFREPTVPSSANANASKPVLPAVTDSIQRPVEADAPTQNLTNEALAQNRLVQDLKRIESALQEIRMLAESGRSVDAELLRAVTEGTVRVTNQIAMSPDSVPQDAVATYFHYVSPGREILSSAQVSKADESALDTARGATSDGLAVAVRYFAVTQTE